MQLARIKGNTVEKIFRDKDGRLVRATFYVYENAGRVKARLVDFVYLTEEVVKSATFFISGFAKAKAKNLINTIGRSVISPFLNFEILYFSGSKPRAPTFA